MIDILILREVVRILVTLLNRALRSGFERATINNAILFRYMSSRLIEECAGCSHQTVGRLATKLLLLPDPLPDFDKLDNAALRILFYPDQCARTSKKRRPPVKAIEKEQAKIPKKHRKNKAWFFDVYKNEDPSTALSRSRFYEVVSMEETQDFECTFEYEPGEVLFCDYAGTKVSFTDEATGENVFAYVFVAVLGYSKKKFAFATPNITAADWIDALVETLHYLNGSPCVIHFDNGQLVKKAGLIASLNAQVDIFKRVYKTVCDTSRVRKSQDNANAEKTVQHITSAVLTWLRDMTFNSIEQINACLLSAVNKINDKPSQLTGLSPNDLFYRDELRLLNELPSRKHKPFKDRVERTSTASGMVRVNNHFYSVPHDKRNKKLMVVIYKQHLEIHDGIDVIAEHTLSDARGKKTLLDEHKHPVQIAEDKKNHTEYSAWAIQIGPNTCRMVDKFYELGGSPRSRFASKRCIFLQQLEARFTHESLEAACGFALISNEYEPTYIESLLESDVFDNEEVLRETPPALLHHKNIRGQQSFREFRA